MLDILGRRAWPAGRLATVGATPQFQHGLLEVSAPRVLFIASDTLGERMAGPGIRSWELSRVLSQHFSVTIVVTPSLVSETESAAKPDFPAELRTCSTASELRRHVDASDVVVTLGGAVAAYPFLRHVDTPLVYDAYDPFLLAGLEQHAGRVRGKNLSVYERYLRGHLWAMRAADFLICASERQRDYWLGMLTALGRVNPYTYDGDPTLDRLIQVVPFGLPSTKPRHLRRVLKGVVPGIDADDRIVLWGGGVWSWFDAPSAVKAIGHVTRTRTDVKLFFMGTKRPNSLVAASDAIHATMDLSRRLDLTNKHVFFNDWVPYQQRQSYLLEADIGLSLHHDTAEARFAFRTRFLDYLWAGLPVVSTTGDIMSDVVRRAELGRVVGPGDETGVADAILDLLGRKDLKAECAARFEQIASNYVWEVAARPLVEFCRNPSLAADKNRPELSRAQSFRTLRDWIPARVANWLSGSGLRRLLRP